MSESLCLATTPGSVACKLCNSALGFFNNGLDQCNRLCVQNCYQIDPSGTKCGQCRTGMIPSGNTCVVPGADLFCKVLDSLGGCEWCDIDKHPSTTVGAPAGSCDPVISLITNCAYYSDANTCKLCKSGYFLYGNACHQLEANCIQSNAPTCLVCNPGYGLLKSSSADPTGTSFASDWFIYSTYGSAPAGSTTCQSLSITNCATFELNGKCIKCQQGYFLNADQNCESAAPAVSHCLIHSAVSTCSECEIGYYVSSGNCVANPGTTTIAPVVENCVAYSSSTECSRCDSTTYLSSNTCTAVSPIIQNCEVYTSGTVCLYCATSFYLDTNACVPIKTTVSNCVAYESTGCVACAAPYYVSAGDCAQSTTTVLNCERYSADGVCQWCGSNYFIKSSACAYAATEYIPNCGVYVTSTSCKFCGAITEVPPTFKLAADSRSCLSLATPIDNCAFHKSTGTCTRCKNGYLNTIGGQCTKFASQNCVEFEAIGKCVGCANGFKPDATNNCIADTPVANCMSVDSTGACRICNTGGYYLSAGQCVSVGANTVANCDIYSADSKCLYCSSGFESVDGGDSCTTFGGAVVQNCLYYSTVNPGICSVCTNTASLIASYNTCDPFSLVSNCEAYGSNGKCVQCSTGNGLDGTNNQCVAVTAKPFCYEYVSSGACVSCEAPYILVSGQCTTVLVTLANCKVRATATTCQICNNGYYLDATPVCVSLNTAITNCKLHSADGTCSECNDSFFLRSNTCTSITQENCKFFTNSFDCAVCDSPYKVNSDFRCVEDPVKAHCLELSSTSDCAICEPTYFTSAGGCEINPLLVPDPTITHCYIYSSLEVCQYCDSGYFLVSPNVCSLVTSSVNNCDLYIANGKCGKCVANAALTSTALCILNCESATGTQCTQCKPNFFIAPSGDCINANNAILNCLYYDTLTKCRYCNTGYELLPDGTCSTSVSVNSLSQCKYTAAPACALCGTGFYLTSTGTCAAVAADKLVDQCLVYSSDTLCRVCPATHFMDFVLNVCTPLPQNAKCFLRDWACLNS